MTEMTFTAETVREMLERAFNEGEIQGYRSNDRSYCGEVLEFEDSEVLKELEDLITHPPF